MKHYLYFLATLFFCYTDVQSQPLSFRNSPVIQITFESVTGYYHPDRHANIGKRDVFVIAYDTTGKRYLANTFKKSTYFTPSSKNEEAFKNEMDMPGYKPHPVEKHLLNKLFDELNRKLPVDSLGMDGKALSLLINDSTVSLIAKKLNLLTKLNEPGSQKEKWLKELSDPETFNSFLKSRMDTTCFYNMNADTWDKIIITIVTTKRSYKFEGNTKETFRQSWFEFSGTDFTKDVAGNDKISQCILNPAINEAILQLLPPEFMSRNFLEKREMTEAFIEWYLRAHVH